MTCAKCKREPATSIASGLCSACLYEREHGSEAAKRQRQLAAQAKERERMRSAVRGSAAK